MVAERSTRAKRGGAKGGGVISRVEELMVEERRVEGGGMKGEG
jgi:hypothetical protein